MSRKRKQPKPKTEKKSWQRRNALRAAKQEAYKASQAAHTVLAGGVTAADHNDHNDHNDQGAKA